MSLQINVGICILFMMCIVLVGGNGNIRRDVGSRKSSSSSSSIDVVQNSEGERIAVEKSIERENSLIFKNIIEGDEKLFSAKLQDGFSFHIRGDKKEGTSSNDLKTKSNSASGSNVDLAFPGERKLQMRGEKGLDWIGSQSRPGFKALPSEHQRAAPVGDTKAAPVNSLAINDAVQSHSATTSTISSASSAATATVALVGGGAEGDSRLSVVSTNVNHPLKAHISDLNSASSGERHIVRTAVSGGIRNLLAFMTVVAYLGNLAFMLYVFNIVKFKC